MNLLSIVRQYVLGLLPYPDLPRRMRVRRESRRLIRLLWLQPRIRRAVRGRRREEAALLARTALDTCLIGLYCVHDGGAVTHLAGANYRTLKRIVTSLAVPGLISAQAVDAAVASLGDVGSDLKVGNVARTLADEHGLTVARSLYGNYYAPLSHFFEHANAFTLLRHVQADDSISGKPWYPWTRRSPARLGDACAGLLAANIAKESGMSPEPFLGYGLAHLGRLRTPLVTMGVSAATRNLPWRRMPGLVRDILAFRAYTHRRGLANTPARREKHVRTEMARLLEILSPGLAEGMAPVMDELTALITADMNDRAGEQDPPSASPDAEPPAIGPEEPT